VKLIIIPKCYTSTRTPKKMEEFQRIIMPPDAPTEGEKEN
jgi:hypothetical protein